MPNKNTADLRDMILRALDLVGGCDYLAARAIDTPGPFLALVGKVLPTQLMGDGATSIFLLHLEAARATSQQLIEGKVEPAPERETTLLDQSLPTE